VLGQDVPFILYVGKPTKRRTSQSDQGFRAAERDSGSSAKLLLIGTSLPGVSFAPLI
jgi:hypothetical protein